MPARQADGVSAWEMERGDGDPFFAGRAKVTVTEDGLLPAVAPIVGLWPTTGAARAGAIDRNISVATPLNNQLTRTC